MISVRLTSCPECGDIPTLLLQIDCKIAEIAKNLYNNTVFMLNKNIPESDLFCLLQYKRILTYKHCNSEYVESVSVKQIASKVIVLLKGSCKECKNCLKETVFPTTTTTTTSFPYVPEPLLIQGETEFPLVDGTFIPFTVEIQNYTNQTVYIKSGIGVNLVGLGENLEIDWDASGENLNQILSMDNITGIVYSSDYITILSTESKVGQYTATLPVTAEYYAVLEWSFNLSGPYISFLPS